MGIGVQANLPGSALNTEGPSFPSTRSVSGLKQQGKGLAQVEVGWRQPPWCPSQLP